MKVNGCKISHMVPVNYSKQLTAPIRKQNGNTVKFKIIGKYLGQK